MTRVIIDPTLVIGAYGNYSADAADFEFVNGNQLLGNRTEFGGKLLLLAYNASGGNRTVYIYSTDDPYRRLNEVAYSLGPGEYAVFGPFEPLAWKQDDGYLHYLCGGFEGDIKFAVISYE